MIDAFSDLWQAMTPAQREGISWMATVKKDGEEFRVIGNLEDANSMLTIATAALDSYARDRSNDYQSYQKEVVESCKGIVQGLLEGTLHRYLHEKP